MGNFPPKFLCKSLTSNKMFKPRDVTGKKKKMYKLYYSLINGYGVINEDFEKTHELFFRFIFFLIYQLHYIFCTTFDFFVTPYSEDSLIFSRILLREVGRLSISDNLSSMFDMRSFISWTSASFCLYLSSNS